MRLQIQCITVLCGLIGLCCACGPTFKPVEVSESKSNSAPSKPTFELPPEATAPDGPKPVSLDGFRPLPWKILRGLEVKTGKTSPELAAFVGANIRIDGFMVPFDDDDEAVSEFLLVPQAGMCIHTPPPPPNQIILVEVANGSTNRVEWDKEVSVFGQFQIADGNSPYGKTGFKVSAVRARPD